VAERDVSVLFVDVEGSTKLAEGLGPKATAELLNEFFEMVTKEIFDHKGSVNKFIGDEVMAIYNAPLDLADHAARAVETAVEVVRKIQVHNKANPTKQFNVHVGINSGPVVAGNVGTHTRMEYTVLGDTVNVCARLCKALPANRITIGEKTYEKIKGKLPYNFKDLGDTMIRGRERSMRAYEVTA
jgi:adenylate cyclase